MTSSKLLVAGLVAGVVLAMLGLIAGAGRSSGVPAAAPTRSVAELQPINGLAPIDDVIELWRSRSEAQPLDYLSRTELGRALATRAREEGDLTGYAEAEVVLDEALALNPSYVPARVAQASVLHAQHRFTEARKLADDVWAADRSALPALALIGDTSLELGDYERAENAYRQLAGRERSAPVVSRLARLAWVAGQAELSVSLAEEALALSETEAVRPDRAAFYHFQLGHYRFETGDAAGARTALDAALTIDPGNGAASERLAFVLSSVGEDEAALAAYARLVSGDAPADVHGLYADGLRAAGQTELADRHDRLGTERATVAAATQPAEWRHLVGFYLTRDPGRALELAEADLAERHDVDGYDTLAWALHHNGRNVEAAEAAELALAQGTRSASFHYHAGAIAAALGRTDEARDHLSTALAINPLFHPTDAPAAADLLTSLSP